MPPENPPLDPVAVPDSVTLFGQAASLVDVLANDVDPSGGLLSVQRADPLAANQLDVAVVNGRWLRISARQGALSPNPQIVRYTISNGRRSGIPGQVVVSQRPPPDGQHPGHPERRRHRARRHLAGHPRARQRLQPVRGTLTLVSDGAGRAVRQSRRAARRRARWSHGCGVRGRPHGALRRADRARRADSGSRSATRSPTSRARPRRARSRSRCSRCAPGTTTRPSRRSLEGRTVSGDTVKLRLPGYGVDPDGDAGHHPGPRLCPRAGSGQSGSAPTPSTTPPTPAASAPTSSPTAITDTLGAIVDRDRAGLDRATRAAAAAAGRPRRDHRRAGTHRPSSTCWPTTWSPPAAASRSAWSTRRRASRCAPRPVRSRSRARPRRARRPQRRGRLPDHRRPRQPRRRTMTLRTRQAYNNPPIVSDAFGAAGDGGTVTVDVLSAGTEASGSTSGAYDPDGPFEDLRVADVYAPQGIATSVAGGRITVERAEQPMVVPFRVEDADGGAATGSLYVPAASSGLPFVRPDALIRLDPGDEASSRSWPTTSSTPSGGPSPSRSKSRMWASPQHRARRRRHRRRHLPVRAAAHRTPAPAAVVFEVTTGTSVDDPDGRRGDPFGARAGGRDPAHPALPRRPASRCRRRSRCASTSAPLCHVWTADPAQADGLPTRRPSTTDSDDADRSHAGRRRHRRGDRGRVGTRPATQAPCGSRPTAATPGAIRIRVVRTPPPSLAPIRVSTLKAGRDPDHRPGSLPDARSQQPRADRRRRRAS